MLFAPFSSACLECAARVWSVDAVSIDSITAGSVAVVSTVTFSDFTYNTGLSATFAALLADDPASIFTRCSTLTLALTIILTLLLTLTLAITLTLLGLHLQHEPLLHLGLLAPK